MSLRLGVLGAVLALCGCAKGGGVAASGRAEGAGCRPGELLLSVPELPSELQPLPAQQAVLVVDRAGLVLRSDRSFEVVRALAPGIDGWLAGAYSADAGAWLGETFDGQRYAVDVATGDARRLYDARLTREARAQREQLRELDPERAFEEHGRRATQLVQAALERNGVPVDEVPELQATAALVTDETLVAADVTSTLWRVDLRSKKVVAREPCAMCASKLAIAPAGAGFLAVDREGVVTRLDGSLKPLSQAPIRSESDQQRREPLHIERILPIDGGARLAWLSVDGQHGLYDVAAGRPIAHLRPTGPRGASAVLFWDEARVAYVTDGRLVVVALRSGKVLLEKTSNFESLARGPEGELLAIRADGAALIVTAALKPGGWGCVEGRPCTTMPRAKDRPLTLGPATTIGPGRSRAGAPLAPPGEAQVQPAAAPETLHGATFTLSVHRTDAGYDRVLLASAGAESILSDDRIGGARVGQLRRGALASVSPAGDAFALGAGGRTPDRLPAGSVQAFCAPRGAFALIPPRPEPGAVAEVEGVLEIALDGLPPRYLSLTASDDGPAWILAAEAESAPRALGRIAPDSTTAALEPLPSLAPFFELATGGGVLWAIAPEELARRGADGQWTRLPLGSAAELRQHVALPNGELVLLRGAKRGPQELVVAGGTLFRAKLEFSAGAPPLVPLPDGVLVPPDRACAGKAACEGGFIVRGGKRLPGDALLAAVTARKPVNAWLRENRLLLLGARWSVLDAGTGAPLEELPPQLVFRRRQHAVGPRPAPTPYLESLEAELIRFVDRTGRPLAVAALRGPAWIPDLANVMDAVDTRTGTWARKGELAVLHWDGIRLRAYFHPRTREELLRELE